MIWKHANSLDIARSLLLGRFDRAPGSADGVAVISLPMVIAAISFTPRRGADAREAASSATNRRDPSGGGFSSRQVLVRSTRQAVHRQ